MNWNQINLHNQVYLVLLEQVLMVETKEVVVEPVNLEILMQLDMVVTELPIKEFNMLEAVEVEVLLVLQIQEALAVVEMELT